VPQTPNILALDVLVTGPEFRSDENRMAFVRIAEAVEQFSAHSRETIVLVRQPTDLDQDHFAILWSRGLAIAGFLNQTGVIHGRATGPWRTEPGDVRFANPFELLGEAAKKLSSRFDHKDRLSLIAIFTGPVRELDVEAVGAELPSFAMTVEHAISRSLVHIPNLLRAIDHKMVVMQHGEIERLALMLDQSGKAGEILAEDDRKPHSYHVPLIPSAQRGRSRLWLIPALLILVGLVTYFVSVSRGPSKIALNDSTVVNPMKTPQQDPLGQIVIEMPDEVQLFVSPQLYQTRLDLDHALAHAEGQRYLPATEQIISYDSLTLAKGVYGYFKVDNAWRKGKLLQTFQHRDTIHIDNFLGPLP
jgi:hypothetical protein